jgi:cytoplasmic iron level regulating protein YaaA (DUF328/UPF0246 family)
VLVLLPPSEGKAAPRRGKPLQLARLAYAEALSPARAQLLDAVDPGLREAPTAAATKVYTGVLFQALRLEALPAPARRRVLLFSGLWGVVRPGDRIPAYKLPVGTKVPGAGPLAALWRGPLREALPDRGLVVDMRSGPYAAMWTPRRATVLTVRAFTPQGTVISHMVKATRGRVGRVLLEAPAPPRTPEQALELVLAAGLRATLAGGSLDVVEGTPA